VGPLPIAVGPPVLDDHARFADAVVLSTVEKFVSQAAMDRVDLGLPPRRVGSE